MHQRFDPLVANLERHDESCHKVARATYRKMMQNLWWAAGYNIVAISAQLLPRAKV